MRFSKMLRRRGEEPRLALITRDFYVRVASYIDTLESALGRFRRDHDVICSEAMRQTEGQACSCGAEEFNQIIENVLRDGEMDSQKVHGTTNKNVPKEKM